MRIAALSMFALWTLTVAGCQNQAAKIKPLPRQYTPNIRLCQGVPRRELQFRNNADRRKANNGAGGDPRAQRKKNERHGISQKPTVLYRYREKFLPHSSNAVLL
jgi:hypothetical protein